MRSCTSSPADAPSSSSTASARRRQRARSSSSRRVSSGPRSPRRPGRRSSRSARPTASRTPGRVGAVVPAALAVRGRRVRRGRRAAPGDRRSGSAVRVAVLQPRVSGVPDGPPTDAVDHLRTSIELSEQFRDYAKQDSDLDAVRDDPAFEELHGKGHRDRRPTSELGVTPQARAERSPRTAGGTRDGC